MLSKQGIKRFRIKFNRTFLLLFISSLSFSLTPPALANPLKELQEEREFIEEKKLHLRSGVEQKENEINTNKFTIGEIQNQLQIVDGNLIETVKNVNRTEVEIMDTQDDIELLHSSISFLEKNITERDVILRERIRSLQLKEGPMNFFEVLLGSTSVSDFMGRFNTVNTLMNADRKIMKQQTSDIEQLVVIKMLISQSLTKQKNNKESLQELKMSLESQKSEKDNLIHDLEVEQIMLSNEKEYLEVAYEKALEKSSEIEQEIIALQNRQTSISEIFPIYTSPLMCSEDSKVNDNMFFAKFNSAGVFTEKGQVFIDIANEYNVDPVLMAAIALHETGSGTSNAIMKYNNPGGLMNPATNWSTLLRFDTLEDGLRSTGRTLAKLIHKGSLTTISDLGSVYAPLGANNDPTGLNSHWAPNVTKFTNELGGLTMNCKNS